MAAVNETNGNGTAHSLTNGVSNGLTHTTSTVLEGKVFAITGGASGIGLATAKTLSRRGATVCIADVDPAAIKAAEEYFAPTGKGRFSVTKVDVAQRQEVDAW